MAIELKRSVPWLVVVAASGCQGSPEVRAPESAKEQTSAIASVDNAAEEFQPGEVLPFARPAMGGTAGPTMQQSIHKWRSPQRHLPDGAPNILIVMLDDSGFGHSATFGGEIQTPTLSRLAQEGISYSSMHNTGMCSPTRASLLTGRNHHRVGAGQIAEFANDWDGYTGEIPKTSATFAEVLQHYGYATAAFGKWHNTPVDTLANGPYDRFPTGHGFDHFYGFIAGETSQWEPVLWENTTPIEAPKPKDHEAYHLTEDMAERAITWMRRSKSVAPEKPFLVYWTPGAVHGPHHVAKKWADKYAGKFDDGWEAYQSRTFERQKKMGWVPEHAQLSPLPEGMPAWSDVPPEQRPFQARLMEIYAGFLEHTDVQVGKLVDALEQMGERENTLIVYIQSDNGASAEGMNGTIAELLAQNGLPTTTEQQIKALEELGGINELGGPRTDNMYNSAWAWAGDAPFKYMKLVASDWGGTRTPMVISWPRRIKPSTTPRRQFHHVNDVLPTLYEVIGIPLPKMVDGYRQDPIDGISFAYTFDAPEVPSKKSTQYFEIMGSRSIYHEGWVASAFGPRKPWQVDLEKLLNWDATNDQWELYDATADYTLLNDLASEQPERLAELKQMWFQVAQENKVLPVGGGLYMPLHPAEMKRSRNTRWDFGSGIVRLPESQAPNLRNGNLTAELTVMVPPKANGVLFALGGFAGGVSLYVLDGELRYEYSSLLMQRTKFKLGKLPTGRPIKITMKMSTGSGRAAAASLVFFVDDKEIGRRELSFTIPAAFTASETFDIGEDTNSPVAEDYEKLSPFRFTGEIQKARFYY